MHFIGFQDFLWFDHLDSARRTNLLCLFCTVKHGNGNGNEDNDEDENEDVDGEGDYDGDGMVAGAGYENGDGDRADLEFGKYSTRAEVFAKHFTLKYSNIYSLLADKKFHQIT